MKSSQLSGAVAAATFALLFSVSSVAMGAEPVKGTGLFRPEQECLRNLPQLGAKLQKAGVRLIKPLDCEEVPGEPESFQPIFEGESNARIEAETAVAAYVNDRQVCEDNLEGLVRVVAEKGERILEAGCVPVSISGNETEELQLGQFQPMVVLLKTAQR